MIFKASDFKYPTLEERLQVNSILPKIESFSFKQIDSVIEVISKKMSPEEANFFDSLFDWNICLQNRISKLSQTFIYSQTYFNRGVVDNYDENKVIESLNLFLFEYYTEIFYYYYFSVRDIICQVINIYLRLKISEDRVSLNDQFLSKLEHAKIKTSLISFREKTLMAKDLRNKFVHKLTPTQESLGITIFYDNEIEKCGWGGTSVVSSTEFKDNMIESLNFLSELMKELNQYIYT